MHKLDSFQQIKKIEALNQIRQSAAFIKHSLRSDDPKEFEAARHAHKDLFDRFYSETSDYIPLSQYKAAERDFVMWINLIIVKQLLGGKK
jgi:hypothetical protein